MTKHAPSAAPSKESAPPPSALSLNALFMDFRLLLILFIASRLLLAMVYQPLVTQGVERGMTAGGDFQTYYQIAALSKDYGLPLRDWWSEFPPLWSYLSVAIYQVQGASYPGFALALAVIFVAADVGNLFLLRRIATRLYRADTAMALAWIYALLVVPLVFVFWTFEVLVAFALLLGLWWLLEDRPVRSALAIALGTLVKFTSAILLGAVWRYKNRQSALRFTLVLMGLVALVILPFLLQNATMTLPSLTAQFSKASYQTVWALLDGNYRTGNFGPLTDRLDPALAAVTLGNPAVVPGWLRLGAAGLLGLFVFWRTRRLDDKGLVAFVAFTLLIFFLQAQGWSPQWLAQIIPLILLCFPSRNGVLIVVVLSLLTFAEYPVLFIRTGDTGGEITGALQLPFAVLVIARTITLISVAVALYGILRQPRDRSGQVI